MAHHDALQHRHPRAVRLPPGQRRVDRLPRFGAHLHRPPPAVPADPAIEVAGAVTTPFALRVGDLASLPRREIVADFHCVAGWSVTDLRWEGVAFERVYRMFLEPAVAPGTSITHVVFEGLDGYRSIVLLEDALADDVVLAEHLDGRPLDSDHGAPVRVVSPSQYGFVSTKHLCRIELCSTPAKETYHRARIAQFGLQLVTPHRRARVWEEERHRYLPAWFVRPIYRTFIAPIVALSAMGRDRGRRGPQPPRA